MLISSWVFLCPKVDAQCAKLCRAGLLRGTAANILPPCNLEIGKACILNNRFELCFQQSASDSASPEVDSLFRCLRHDLLHEDVTDLESPVRFEHPDNFGQGSGFVRHQIEHAI